ncbi:DUF6252 family protein [Desertivirga arenae]|uniref:DUF6252 family protein n=1 Tax=Desertivirga arenae TaxID=2810309 RepID=UPI001A96DC2D|nr:DUF6252 family protein [Pedobacter sp. SYSU D00823]
MKYLKSALLVLTVCLFGFTACKKDNDDSSAESSMSAKVSGAAKTTITPPTAVYYSSAKAVQISGQFTSTTGISIMIDEPKVGTYDVSEDQVMAMYLPTNAAGVGYMGNSGTVKITEWSESRVKGTFEFTGEALLSDETITISEGKFDVKVTKM